MHENSDTIEKLKSEGWLPPYKNKENQIGRWTHPRFSNIELDCESNYGEVRVKIIKKNSEENFTFSKVDVFLAESILGLILEQKC